MSVDERFDLVGTAVEHGEVFTRRWVVDLVLDLCGYTPDRDLARLHAVEPACGAGAFIGPMVERLSDSLRTHGRSLGEAAGALHAFDLLEHNVAASRALAASTLRERGWEADEAAAVAEKWVEHGDYLLRGREDGRSDVVVGNPPYIRLEDVPPQRTSAYRAACPTMGGRADVYVGFIEAGLRSLRQGGFLAFIVADRWMHNAYGSRLRRLVTSGWSVDVTVVMHDVDAFEEHVSAYPAISVIRRGEQGPSVVADTTRSFGERHARDLVAWTQDVGRAPLTEGPLQVDRLPHWFPGEDLWPAGPPLALAMVEDLDDRFHPLEDPTTGTRVGIGVATGADAVYVTTDTDTVEAERLLPLAMAADTGSGSLEWSGHHLVNPWDEHGLVALEDWPRFAAYVRRHGPRLRGRSIATRNPARWWRTIDRVTRGLAEREKLLFPDMRMTSRPVHDLGGFYPHHNVYYVVSEDWDLKVLGGLLFSKVSEQTVSAYCVKMRGGTLRFQAQYLRRVRVPRPGDVSEASAVALADAFARRDPSAATEAALEVYGITGPTADWLRRL